jgi:hypothetical protein
VQRCWIDELLVRKAALREGDSVELEASVRSWIEAWLLRSGAAAPTLPGRKGDVARLDELFLDVVRGFGR